MPILDWFGSHMGRADLTKGPIGKSLFLFALPILLGNLFQQFYNMVDSMVVGRYVGENALAAVGASYALSTVFISIAVGGGIGASVLTSRYLGAKDYKNLHLSISTSMISFFVFSVILGIFGFMFSPTILRALNTPPVVQEQADIYLKIYFIGLPFLFMYNIISSIFNALGKSRIPLYFLAFSSALNIVLDLYTVRVLQMGVAGVAIATLIAQGLSAILSFMVLVKLLKGYPKEKKAKHFDLQYFGKMLTIAIPSIIQQSIVSIGMMLVQSVVNGFGEATLAGFSAAMRIESICVVPLASMGNAVSTFVAQNLGAGQKERATKGYHISYGIILAFGFIIMVVLEFFNVPIIQSFLGKDVSPEVLYTGTSCLKFMGFFYAILGFKMCTDGVLRGAGDMKVFTWANLLNLSIRVCFSYLFAPILGISAVWIAVPIGWSANYLVSFIRYKTGKWKKIVF